MIMMAITKLSDLEKRYRPLFGDEKAKAEALIDDAEALIGAHLSAPLSSLDARLVISVVCAMVKRAMAASNTEYGELPITNTSRTAGSYSESFTFANPAGDLYLTGQEKKSLGIGKARIGTIRPKIAYGAWLHER